MGREMVSESVKRRYMSEPKFDIGETPSSFEDDGSGHCLVCRRAGTEHVGGECPGKGRLRGSGE